MRLASCRLVRAAAVVGRRVQLQAVLPRPCWSRSPSCWSRGTIRGGVRADLNPSRRRQTRRCSCAVCVARPCQRRSGSASLQLCGSPPAAARRAALDLTAPVVGASKRPSKRHRDGMKGAYLHVNICHGVQRRCVLPASRARGAGVMWLSRRVCSFVCASAPPRWCCCSLGPDRSRQWSQSRWLRRQYCSRSQSSRHRWYRRRSVERWQWRKRYRCRPQSCW